MIDLTPTESRILRLRATGMSVDEVARAMRRSSETIKHHASNAYEKIGADSLVDAVYRLGWLRIPVDGQCSVIAQCGRAEDHRGQHGGFHEGLHT